MKATHKMVCYRAKLEAKRLRKMYPNECSKILHNLGHIDMMNAKSCIYGAMFGDCYSEASIRAKIKIKTRTISAMGNITLYSNCSNRKTSTLLEIVGIRNQLHLYKNEFAHHKETMEEIHKILTT